MSFAGRRTGSASGLRDRGSRGGLKTSWFPADYGNHKRKSEAFPPATHKDRSCRPHRTPIEALDLQRRGKLPGRRACAVFAGPVALACLTIFRRRSSFSAKSESYLQETTCRRWIVLSFTYKGTRDGDIFVGAAPPRR